MTRERDIPAAGAAGTRKVMVRDMVTAADMEIPLAELLARDARYHVLVWDAGLGQFAAIPRLEAAAGMFRYAESFGPGTWACWAASERAMELLGDNVPWGGRLRKAGTWVPRSSRAAAG